MRFATYNGEKTIDQLAQRLFGDAAKTQPVLVQELVALNPQLDNLSTLAPGTPLVLPDDAPVLAAEERTTGRIEQVLTAIDDLERRQNEAAEQRIASIRSSVELAKLPELQAAVRTMPEVSKRLEEIVDAAPERVKQVIADRNAAVDALKRARAAVGRALARRRAVSHGDET